MQSPNTEQSGSAAKGLDLLPDAEIVRVLANGQQAALGCLEASGPDIARAGALMAQVITDGGRLIYAAAGSSALMALADAAELGGTFGIPAAQIRMLMAGGVPVDAQMPGDTEDDAEAATVAANGIGRGDLLIALTASGSTPYPVELARCAAQNGAQVIAIANNPGAKIFNHADVAICLETPPEVIAGSTRLGAATAQKAALNLMSTLMGVRLGHVHDGLMVNVFADNEKLRARAMGIVCQITGCTPERATRSIAAARGAVKPAILLAAGMPNLEAATTLLATTHGNLRAALAQI
jgi:N-acetylmuramic acid 6-phosphate etherase